MNKFSSEFFEGNRRHLLDGSNAELVIIAGHRQLQRSGDTTYPFRQDSNFWYLCGIDEPDCVLVLTPTAQYVITPQRGRVHQIFDGTLDTRSLAAVSGIEDIMTSKEGWARLKGELKTITKAAVLLPPNPRRLTFAANPGRRMLLQRLKRYRTDLQLIDIRTELAELRCIKQPVELDAIKEAISITCNTLQEVRKVHQHKPFMHEYQVEAAISAGFRFKGASGHAYDPIVAGGKNACTLHYVDNSRKLNPDELLLIDAGAEYSHYAADITRVWPVSAEYTERQKAVIDAVILVHTFALNYLRPGVLFKDYEQAVEKFMGKQLQKLGLLKKPHHHAIRYYYPHAASHFLGLDVHDAGDYKKPLQENMVITVEPGIYIPEEGIGVRLEDDVLITKNGVKVLSADLPLI